MVKYLTKFLLDYSFCSMDILVLYTRMQLENDSLPVWITDFSVITSTGITLQTIHNLLMHTTYASRVNHKSNSKFWFAVTGNTNKVKTFNLI